MEAQKANWFYHPTKKVIILVVTVCFLGNLLLILAFTDLLTTNFKATAAIGSLMTGSAVMTFKLVMNYFKNKS